MNSTPEPGPLTESAFVCECHEWGRSACTGLPFYGEHGGKSYCVLHYPGKEKKAAFDEVLKKKLDAKDFNLGGVWFPDVLNLSGITFSTAAYFAYATFSGVADFSEAIFKAGAQFTNATFNSEAYFGRATFNQAYFSSATFSATAYFFGAIFDGNPDFNTTAVFFQATFSAKATFTDAIFRIDAFFLFATFSGEADFRAAIFSKTARFSGATFGHYVSFSGEAKQAFGTESALDLQYARIAHPELVSFHTLTLRPHWFINVDARKFDFINVAWRRNLADEVASLESQDLPITNPRRLLSITYRQLAVNAEENHRYGEASDFRFGSMDAWRLEWMRGNGWWSDRWKPIQKTAFRLVRSWKRDWGMRWKTWRRLRRFLQAYRRSLGALHWLYWAASGYGEKVNRAVGVLLGVWLLFGVSYLATGFATKTTTASASGQTAVLVQDDEVGKPLPLKRAFTYSLGVMSLQKPEPRPVTAWAQTLVTLETILGPLQAALLALAIRRRFMR